MTDKYAMLKSNVSMLGYLLGNTIQAAHGDALLEKIEKIRTLSKSASTGNLEDRTKLIQLLQNLSDEEMLPVARAFNHFLNFVNIAEQHHSISRFCEEQTSQPHVFDSLFSRLNEQSIPHTDIHNAAKKLKIDLVLTAHPTEIARRTTIHKWVQINHCLSELELTDLSAIEKERTERRLEQLVAQTWYSNDIREQRPSPLDEAKWGYIVIENSLWHAVPEFLRQFDQRLKKHLSERLSVDASPIQISSWVGGDRDGNPFVTSQVTREVLLLSRWRAADLYLKDINELTKELSITECTQALKELAGDHHEPYRAVLRRLKKLLLNTLTHLSAQLANKTPNKKEILTDIDQLWTPLHTCYHSLHQSGMGIIADGLLLDTLRRIRCFGINLVKLDIRQESGRHTEALSEITRYLGMGDYAQWNEQDKQSFLMRELTSKRPLIPQNWTPSESVQEVLKTFETLAQHPREAFGAYVISMTHTASDILAVHLLLKETGCPYRMDVCPLFETLDDLNRAKQVIQQLFDIEWYRGITQTFQMVMIGYSDSAKDAGAIAAGWAQYQAMEELVELSEQANIDLVLFHGRGGTIGRGGAPAHAALLSQPPRSLEGGLRVTEQGEMIRFKFGLPQVAIDSLDLYASAILEANLLPPPEPKQEWRELMDELSQISCQTYRNVVRNNEDFVPYFRSATPEQELTELPLGSRPSKRNPKGGVESLRAIPWIFAWSQNRLLLPAWLGAGEALQSAIDAGHLQQLEDMCREWPFFSTRIGMLQMVYLKTNTTIAKFYDENLVDPRLWYLGDLLRTQLKKNIDVVQMIENHGNLMSMQPWNIEAIQLRNVYIEPLNMLQCELLARTRHNSLHTTQDSKLSQALMVTIAGIAAGLRNTG